jgi:hypothetical protein
MRHLIERWFRPSGNLGLHMTGSGMVLLMVSLLLSHLSPQPMSFDPDDWLAASRVIGYVAGCWAMWLIGALLVIAGAARILSMLDE